MLQEKYLPNSHFAEAHTIAINSSPERVWRIVSNLEFSHSRLIRFLFALRGMPARMMTLEELQRSGFIRLEQHENSELIIGLIGQFWKPSGNLQKFDASEFRSWVVTGFAKATWSFKITTERNLSIVETETRIQCLDEKSRSRFAKYWFFIRPFSGVIRRAILRSIKREAEQQPS